MEIERTIRKAGFIVSQILKNKSEYENGKCLFAFCFGGCDCMHVLGVFQSGSNEHLMDIPIYNKDLNLFYEIDYDKIYSELTEKINEVKKQ